MTELERIGDYVVTRRLGAGGQATAWLAHLVGEPDKQLLLKTFHVAVADDWKTAELFERAANTLERLDHPQIPTYRDHFEVETGDGEVLFCLAREFAAGESLQERIDSGGSYSEDEVIEIALKLLDVLEYLHEQEPPVVHRDIKPANVVMGEDGVPRLVDFGAVQAEVLDETGGSTIVGTAGYVAPEQLMGRAEPASDIYALGVTLVHLITGVPPIDLPSDGFELDVSEILETSSGLAYVVGRMTRADIDAREHSIERLRDQLQRLAAGDQLVVRSTTLPVKIPIGSRLTVVEDETGITVQSPRALVWDSSRTGRAMRWLGLLVSQSWVTGSALFIGLMVWGVMQFNPTAFPYVVLAVFVCVVLPIGAFMTRLRAPVQVQLADEELKIYLPALMGPMTSKQDSGRLDETQALVVRRNFEVPYESVKSVDVGSAPLFFGIGLKLDVEHGITIKNQSVYSMRGSVLFDLGFTHGEYLWLERLIEARRAQFYELHPELDPSGQE